MTRRTIGVGVAVLIALVIVVSQLGGERTGPHPIERLDLVPPESGEASMDLASSRGGSGAELVTRLESAPDEARLHIEIEADEGPFPSVDISVRHATTGVGAAKSVVMVGTKEFLAVVTTGEYEVIVSRRDLILHRQRASVAGPEHTIRLRATDLPHVRGRILTSAGGALEGASVSLVGTCPLWTGEQLELSTATDAAGHYVFWCTPVEAVYRVFAVAPRHVSRTTPPQVLSAESARLRVDDMTLEQGYALHVDIQSEADLADPGREFTLTVLGPDTDTRLTGDTPQFTIDSLRRGTYRLWSESGQLISPGPVIVEVPETRGPVGVKLVHGSYVDGAVLFDDGTPGARVAVVGRQDSQTVQLMRHERADASGAFRLGPFFPSAGRVTIESPLYGVTREAPRQGSCELFLGKTAPAILDLVVTDAAGSPVITTGSLEVTASGRTTTYSVQTDRSGNATTYVVIPQDTQHVRLLAPGWEPADVPLTNEISGFLDGDVVLARRAPLEIRVVDSRREPIASAYVSVSWVSSRPMSMNGVAFDRSNPGHLAMIERTDASGLVSVAAPTSDPRWLTVTAAGHYAHRTGIAGVTGEVLVTLHQHPERED